MKLTFLAFFLGLMSLSAASTYSQNKKITLDLESATLIDVFKQIESQSEFVFIYKNETINLDRKVDVKIEGATVDKVLEQVLQNFGVKFEIDNKQIIITPDRTIPTIKNEIKINEAVPQPQKKEISGSVKDTKGESIPGVTVVVKGTTTGTVTDSDGKFTLILPLDAKTLMFSFIGMKMQEISTTGKSIINTVMIEEAAGMDEVVVIGYGTSLKSQLGGSSIGTVKVDEMKKASVTSFEEALSGRVAGVQVTSSEGGPLAENNVVIRGNNSVTQGNSPLWVIDGFPLENAANNTINPSDIKSITILKDAASTAIYGSRGANGVILVTTNQGKSGAPLVTFDGYYGIQTNLKTMDLMNPYEYVKLQTEWLGVSAKTLYTPGDPTLTPAQGYTADGRTLDYYKTQQAIDWQKQMYQTAPIQNYSVSLSGGTDKSRYLVSGSFADQQGTIIATAFRRYQGRVVFNQEINRKTNFNLNVNYANTSTKGNMPGTGFSGASTTSSLLYAVWGYRPAVSPTSTIEAQLDSAIDPDGQLAYAYNPIVSTNNSIINSQANNLIANSSLDYKIIEGLTLRISGGINYTQKINNTYYGTLTSSGNPTGNTGPNGTIDNAATTSLLNENTLNYKKILSKKHSLDLLAGFSTQRFKTINDAFRASWVPNDALGTSGIDEGTPYAIVSGSSNNFLCSYFGRVNYNYQSKYFLTAVARADGSSKFAPGNKWGYFPSGAAAWNMAKEEFMKEFTFLSDLKLKGSYGVSGNNRVSDFAYLAPVILSDVRKNYVFGSTYIKGAVQPTLGNSNLKWETTATTDIGLELSLFKRRIELEVDYYKKVTSNLLLQATTPGSIGYTSAMKNIGSVRNSGWEFSLNTINVTNKKFEWNSNFNISFNANKVLSLSSGQSALISTFPFDNGTSFPYIAQVGGPIAQIIGFKWIGNYQYADFDKLPTGAYVLKANIPAANGSARTAILPGDIKFEDINGDGILNDADKVVIGNPNPLFTGGFANNFTYRGFDLNVLMTFSYGNDILNANRQIFEGSRNVMQNQFATFVNRWTPENQTNLYPRAGGAQNAGISSRVVEDGSFLRLKTISLGYRIPQNILQRVNVKNMRIYCSAQNIAVWTNYQGSDPEVSVRPTALTPGFDFAAYPRSFSLTFGFNFSF